MKIDFVFFDAGGGHRSAATALKAVIEQQGLPWDVRLVNLQEFLDSLDIFRKLTGIRMQDIYNNLLAKGWTLGSEYLVPGMHAVIRMYHRKQVEMLAREWSNRKPDLVVSVVPNFNRAFHGALQQSVSGVPLVTILTDFADYPPHFWMEQQDQYFICGTERAVEQARTIGHPTEKVFRVSGMILRPTFYEPVNLDRTAERMKLGLAADTPTGLVLFGGQGSPTMTKIARHLVNSNLDVQLIFICGKNEKLAAELRSMGGSRRIHVVGFTSEVPKYMHLSDFFIGKPGPGSISEAIAMRLPVIIERNAWTLPQERYNADWVTEKQVGIVINSFSQIESALRGLIATSALETMRANAAAIENRAVFEIPPILQQIVRNGKRPAV